MKLPLKSLLEKLPQAKITLHEIRDDKSERTVTYIFSAEAPRFPFGNGRKALWYALTLDEPQQLVDEREVDALLRHLWHADKDLFDAEDWVEDSARNGAGGQVAGA